VGESLSLCVIVSGHSLEDPTEAHELATSIVCQQGETITPDRAFGLQHL
jgi:hypothetical protein